MESIIDGVTIDNYVFFNYNSKLEFEKLDRVRIRSFFLPLL